MCCFFCYKLGKCDFQYKKDIFCCSAECITKIQETPMFKLTEKLKESLETMQKKNQELEKKLPPAAEDIDLEIESQQVIK